MSNNIQIFNTLLREAISKHYAKVKNEFDGLYGYSLYTADDLPGIVAVCNCESDIEVSSSDEMYSYYRYGAIEWQHFDDYGLFDEVNTWLTQFMDCEDEWADRKQQILKACLDELIALDNSGIFGAKDSGRFIAICLTDSDDPIMDHSAKELNSSEVYNAYTKEFSC